MQRPKKLYRFRPLDKTLLERELSALSESYLFAPAFSEMNDPMEAFYETGDWSDVAVDALLSKGGGKIEDIYKMLRDTTQNFGLVSFAATFDHLPMWAYYASNFGGMCLEFDTDQIELGGLKNEVFRSVTYAKHPLPPITFADLAHDAGQDAIIARLTRKRSEWSHEREWRFATGARGARHYVDDALKRVLLGPRVDPVYAKAVCQILANRPVEVLAGEVHGFDLKFRTIQKAQPLETCDRVGAGRFDPSFLSFEEGELRNFLLVPYEDLIDECRRIALRPNMDEFNCIQVGGPRGSAVFVGTSFLLRNGTKVYGKQLFDRRMKSVVDSGG